LGSFVFSPSIGASVGLIMIWNSNLFDSFTVQVNSFAISMKFTSKLDNKSFLLSNIYGPAHSAKKLLLSLGL